MLVPRPRTQGAPIVVTTGATEDPVSGRAARFGDTAHVSSTPPVRRLEDRLHDRVEVLVLRQAGDRPGGEEGVDLAHVRRGGQADDRDVGTCCAKRLRRLDAVERRQAVVHDDDVRVELAAEVDDLRPVLDGPDDLDLSTQAEQELEGLSKHLVVLDQRDADRRRHRASLSRRVWRNIARRRGAMLVPRPRTQGAPIVVTTGATEDPVSGRAAWPGDSDPYFARPSCYSAASKSG